MKVVLFCGGRGLRLREHSEAMPKPMVQIGYRPILWHVMRYYAHFGHRDFILCLGYRADAIKDYFLHYDEAVSNDFVLSEGGRRVELLGSDIADWRITFADTGLDTTIGERLRRVRHLLEGEEMFLANYGDTLTDAPLDRLVEEFRADTATAALLSVRPSYSFHIVDSDASGWVTSLRDVATADLQVNGGSYMFRPEIFDVLDTGTSSSTGRLPPSRRRGVSSPIPTRASGSPSTRSRTSSCSSARGPGCRAVGRMAASDSGATRRMIARVGRRPRRYGSATARVRKRRSAPSEPSASCWRIRAIRWKRGPSTSAIVSPTSRKAARELGGSAPRVPGRPRSPSDLGDPVAVDPVVADVGRRSVGDLHHGAGNGVGGDPGEIPDLVVLRGRDDVERLAGRRARAVPRARARNGP